jgi:hypothetical protein
VSPLKFSKRKLLFEICNISFFPWFLIIYCFLE